MNSNTTDPPSQEFPLVEQEIHQPTAHPVHSLNEQPNVILDLIFSHLVVSDLEDVFSVSQRFAAHLRRRSSGVHNPEMAKLFKPADLQRFLFLTHHWCLRTLLLQCNLGVSDFFLTEFPSAALHQLAISRECPRLAEASVCFFNYEYSQDVETSIIAIDEFIGSFSGCRFLRSFDYSGPFVPSLGRLKQLEALKVGFYQECLESFQIILQNLSHLRSLSFNYYYFSLDCLQILQTFPDLEEVGLFRIFPGAIEELIKLPLLKTIILLLDVPFKISPIWGEFKALQRLVLKGEAMKDKIGILPQIPSLRSVELFDQHYYLRPWQLIQIFLCLNLQVESCIVHILKYEIFYHSINLVPMMEFLENHPNLKRLRVMENRNDVLTRAGTANYSHYVNDRGFFWSPQHCQEFIDGLRKLTDS